MPLTNDEITKVLKILALLDKDNANRFRGKPGILPTFKISAVLTRDERPRGDYIKTMRALTQAVNHFTVALKYNIIDSNQFTVLQSVIHNIKEAKLAVGNKLVQRRLAAALGKLEASIASYVPGKKSKAPNEQQPQQRYGDADQWVPESSAILGAIESNVQALQKRIDLLQSQIPIRGEGLRHTHGFHARFHPPAPMPGASHILDEKGRVHRIINSTYLTASKSPGATTKVSQEAIEAKQFLIRALESKIAKLMERLLKSFVAAVNINDYRCARQLMNHKNFGLTPLMVAVKKGDELMVNLLLVKLAELDLKVKKPLTSYVLRDTDRNGDTVFMLAVKAGNQSVFVKLANALSKEALEKTFLLQNPLGDNVLMLAIKYANLDMIAKITLCTTPEFKGELLLQQNKEGDNAFMIAAKQGNSNFAEIFLRGILVSKPEILRAAFAARNQQGQDLRDIILSGPNAKLHQLLNDERVIQAFESEQRANGPEKQ